MPGKAQNRSMGARTSSASATVSANGPAGWCRAPRRASWAVDSSRVDQASVLTCHRLL